MTTFRTQIHTVFLSLLFLLGGLTLQAQYRVGSCASATHANLQNAFNDLMASTISGTFTIEICPGTYVDQAATLGALTYSGTGGNVVITKAPVSPAPVILRANHPGFWTVLSLDGAQHVTIKNLTFQVTSSASRTGYMLVEMKNGAGYLDFENCVFDSYNLNPLVANFSSRLVWSTAVASDRDGSLSFDNCHFLKGGTGIYAWDLLPGTLNSDLSVTNCWFMDQVLTGLTLTHNIGNLEFSQNHLESHDFSPLYYGLENEYMTSQQTLIQDNEVLISNKEVAFGLTDNAFFTDCSDNFIDANEISREFTGILLGGFSNEALVQANTVNYHRGIGQEAQDSSAIGILVRSTYSPQGGAPGTNFVRILDNNMDLDNLWESHGVWLHARFNSSANQILIEGNSVHLHGGKHLAGPPSFGIRVDGENMGLTDLQVHDNLVNTFFGVPPVMFGIQIRDIDLNGPMTLMNNKVDIDAGRPYSAGMLIRDISPAPGTINYVGNNTISMLGHMLMNRGIFSTDVAQTEFHHNSINIHGSFSGTPGSIAMDINTINPANSYAIDLRNNILSNPAGGKAVRIGHAPSVGMNDFNLLYNGSSSGLADYAGSIANTLSDWQSLSGNAANSISANPQFLSNSDLHIYATSPAFQQADFWTFPGYASLLDSDIDGLGREPAGFREIGADEIADPAYPGGNKKAFVASHGELLLFPNPASENVSLRFSEAADWSVSLIELGGKILLQKQQTGKEMTLDISELPAGVYLLRARSPQQQFAEKLIIE